MNIIFVLIAISLSIALTFLLIFIGCITSGQYDDIFAPALRILFDNAEAEKSADTPPDAAGWSGSEDLAATSAGAQFQDLSALGTGPGVQDKSPAQQNEFPLG
jgi:cbb3-type cytochrome oxidase maturation protein